MIRRLLGIPRRTPDPELVEAKRRTAASRRQAAADLRQSTQAREESRSVAAELRRHNDSNGYSRWLENQVLGGEGS